ncbi:hypothetical protein BJX99DRAFT_121558 [Aspergillus californicus]
MSGFHLVQGHLCPTALFYQHYKRCPRLPHHLDHCTQPPLPQIKRLPQSSLGRHQLPGTSRRSALATPGRTTFSARSTADSSSPSDSAMRADFHISMRSVHPSIGTGVPREVPPGAVSIGGTFTPGGYRSDRVSRSNSFRYTLFRTRCEGLDSGTMASRHRGHKADGTVYDALCLWTTHVPWQAYYQH